MNDVEFGYVTGQGHAGYPDLLAKFGQLSDEIAARGDARLDISYGPHPRQRLDLFPATGQAFATLVYLHAGYWQSRDKATFRFIAASFNQAGLDVVLMNYPLCPEATVESLTEAAAAALPAIAEVGGGPGQLLLSGHSAGAHLAVELAMRGSVAGVVGLSGVYDLRPLTGTTLNRNLALDMNTAAAASPLLRITRGMPPGIFAVGGAETCAFSDQTHAMGSAWSAAGADAREITVAHANHFTILTEFTDRSSELHRATLDLASAGNTHGARGQPA